MKEEKSLFSQEASGWFRGVAIIMVILSHYGEWWSWFHVEEGNREIIRLGLSKMGPYGVAIFFLFSGYGLAKSAGKERINILFVIKRVLNVYIPYLVIVLLIEMLSGGFRSITDFSRILYGQDFWYMTVIFLFYLGFMGIWFILKNQHLRIFTLCLYIFFLNRLMQDGGKQDFWYLSNWGFPIGAALSVYEPIIKKIMDKWWYIITGILGVITGRIVYLGLYGKVLWNTPEEEILCRMWAVVLFALFVICLACVWKKYDPILQIMGKYSLYFYLTHTFLFMAVINYLEVSFSLRFIVATVVIFLTSLVLGKITELFCGLIWKQVIKLEKVH